MPPIPCSFEDAKRPTDGVCVIVLIDDHVDGGRCDLAGHLPTINNDGHLNHTVGLVCKSLPTDCHHGALYADKMARSIKTIQARSPPVAESDISSNISLAITGLIMLIFISLLIRTIRRTMSERAMGVHPDRRGGGVNDDSFSAGVEDYNRNDGDQAAAVGTQDSDNASHDRMPVDLTQPMGFPGEFNPDGSVRIQYLTLAEQRPETLCTWCKDFGLPMFGNKADLQRRLAAFSAAGEAEWKARLNPGAQHHRKGPRKAVVGRVRKATTTTTSRIKTVRMKRSTRRGEAPGC